MKDVKIFIPYIATAMITLLICWFLWNTNDDEHIENERRQLAAQREVFEAREKQFKADSIAIRDEMKRNELYWKRKYEELDEEYARLEKNARVDLSDFSNDQLDSIRKRLYPTR